MKKLELENQNLERVKSQYGGSGYKPSLSGYDWVIFWNKFLSLLILCTYKYEFFYNKLRNKVKNTKASSGEKSRDVFFFILKG